MFCLFVDCCGVGWICSIYAASCWWPRANCRSLQVIYCKHNLIYNNYCFLNFALWKIIIMQLWYDCLEQYYCSAQTTCIKKTIFVYCIVQFNISINGTLVMVSITKWGDCLWKMTMTVVLKKRKNQSVFVVVVVFFVLQCWNWSNRSSHYHWCGPGSHGERFIGMYHRKVIGNVYCVSS